jgi:hypothetical protein
MSDNNEIVFAAQNNVDVVSMVSRAASAGPMAVQSLTMALDRLDDDFKHVYIDNMYTTANERKQQFLSMYAPKEQWQDTIVRNSDGSIVFQADGVTPYTEKTLVPSRYDNLLAAIATPLVREQ